MANYNRPTTLEDYYSDDSPPRSSSSSIRVSPQSPMFRKRGNSVHRNSIRNRKRNYLRDESEDEEEINRAMYELGLENNRFGNVSRRSSYDYFEPHPPPPSPGYYRPYMEEAPPVQFMVPPHLQERYAPPPHWIPPYMMDDMSPRPPMYPRPSPLRSRSYTRRPRQRQEYVSHDDAVQDDDVSPDEEEHMHRAPLSRQNSIGSTGSRRNVPLPRAARRSNSVSSMPHGYFYPPMIDPRFMPPMVHSEPSSPLSSDSETEQHPRRRSSMTMPYPSPGLDQNLSFSGAFPQPPIMMPPPMPQRPNLQHTASMYSLPRTEFFDPINSPHVPSSAMNTDEGAKNTGPSIQPSNVANPLLPQMPSQQQMPGQLPQQMPGQLPQQMPGQLPQQKPGQMMPPWLSGFPNSPGNMMQPLGPMMGLFNNPMMPHPPMFHFLPPDVWMSQPEAPLPFMNTSDETQQPTGDEEPEIPPEEEEGSMPPPSRPMLKRGLSKLGGWLGGPKRHSADQTEFSKKDQKRAREYQKLGVFYCWRMAETQDNFESFSIPNQKIIKRKVEKGQRAHILLQKEKKLPGGIIIDLQTWRGCSMGTQNKQNVVVYLEIKEQDFNSMGADFVFGNGY